MPALPNFLVIGTMKGGTSSLHFYLGLHPEIYTSSTKEVNYFTARRNWGRGERWYRRHFDSRFRVRGESSPAYARYPQHKQVPERIHALIPEVKLIYLVRDPVRRAYSHYLHQYAVGSEHAPVQRALRQKRYLSAGEYAMQLERYLRIFRREQILLLRTVDLKNERQKTLAKVFRFLEVDEQFVSPHFDELLNVSTEKRRLGPIGRMIHGVLRAPITRLPMRIRYFLFYPFSRAFDAPMIPTDLEAWLRAYYEEDIARFTEITGLAIEGW